MHRVVNMSDSVSSSLAGLVSRLRIAHHVPGRVRFKLEEGTGLSGALAEAKAFVDSLDAVDGISAINLNLLARSCTVEYDPKRISPLAWKDLVGGIDSPEAAALSGLLAQRWAVVRAR